MSILEEAEQFRWKAEGQTIMNGMREIGITDINLNLIEVLRYFDITSLDRMRDKEAMRKAQIIYEHFKDSEDILSDIRSLESKIGKPIGLEEKMDKLYSHIYSLNLEKGFQEEKEIKDRRLGEELTRRQIEKEKMEKEKERADRRERLGEKQKATERERAIRREKYLKTKQETELQERINKIEKARASKLPEVPKVKI